MDASQWIGAFAGELGKQAPDQAQIDEILKLAAVAAHASERIAAPIACYLAGLTGRPLDELIAMAEELSG
jgi:hypothetical protein